MKRKTDKTQKYLNQTQNLNPNHRKSTHKNYKRKHKKLKKVLTQNLNNQKINERVQWKGKGPKQSLYKYSKKIIEWEQWIEEELK